jgi:hypothetical protein
MKQIFRSIVLNENEAISEEIGRSWTTDEVFAQDHARDYNRFAAKDGFVILSTWVNDEDIDMENTNLAADRRPLESEIVLKCNIQIEAEICFSKIWGIELGTIVAGHAGERTFEDYM